MFGLGLVCAMAVKAEPAAAAQNWRLVFRFIFTYIILVEPTLLLCGERARLKSLKNGGIFAAQMER